MFKVLTIIFIAFTALLWFEALTVKRFDSVVFVIVLVNNLSLTCVAMILRLSLLFLILL